jgi:23S rRNA (uracil1939-C5)-methyltransferase
MVVELTVETLTVGGRGLGRHEGKAVFVPLTAPGDRARCRIVRRHRHYDEAELLELLQPAPERRPPPCPVFGQCGGCQWQHLPYGEQAAWKERLFAETLTRAGVATSEVLRPLVAAAEFGYRNRVQFKCHRTRTGVAAGFYRHGSHYVVDTPACLLAHPAISQAFTFLRGVLPAAPHPEAIPQVDISCGDDGQVGVLCHVLPPAAAVTRNWLVEIAGRGGFAAALQTGRKESIDIVHGDPALTCLVDEPELALRISPGGFSQVNPRQNRRLVAAVLSAAELSGNERVLDLYCGAGNFSLPLARRAGTVVGVEAYPPAIADARANAARLGIDNASFLAEPAEGAAPRLAVPVPFDLVLLDPPRTGAYALIADLLSIRPPRILYVSCDPATLVRDLKPLVHNGYRVLSSQPFDLFPQTWHIESLTVLERNR